MNLKRLFILHLLLLGTFAPSSSVGAAEFFRGINLNGPAVTIDGHAWLADSEGVIKVSGSSFENQNVPLKPRLLPSARK